VSCPPVSRPPAGRQRPLISSVFLGGVPVPGCAVEGLSRHDVRLSSPHAVPDGAVLRLVLSDPDALCAYVATARVAGCEARGADTYRVGARFVCPLSEGQLLDLLWRQ